MFLPVNKSIVFMGTPQFAVPTLERLLVEKYSVLAVYTRPDKPTGRGQRLLLSPVKKLALKHDIPVMQPDTLKSSAVLSALNELNPELIVVAAFGLILPEAVLSIPKHGCFNIHPSLLPSYRGPSPVAYTLLGGEQTSGVTLILMDKGMDSGPIIAQRKIVISSDDTTGSLTDKLALEGADLLIESLPLWLSGRIKPKPQDDSKATYSRIINAGDGLIDWSLSAVEIGHRIRAFYPWPGTYTRWEGKRIKIHTGIPLTGEVCGQPGKVVALYRGEGIGVVTGDGYLKICQLQLEGKEKMSSVDFARGQRTFVGSVLV
jgi:methionyl-tRNA formyltransferase